MTRSRFLLLAFPLFAACLPARAGGEDMASVAREREAIESRYATEAAQCQQHFVVTDCLSQAKQRRSEALKPVVQREQALAQQERERRAAASAERLKAKSEEHARREAAGPSAPAVTLQQAPQAAASEVRGVDKDAEIAQRLKAQQQRRRDDEAQAAARRQELHERLEQAQAHREAVLQRNAQRAAQKPPAAPLPLPGAPSTPASHPR